MISLESAIGVACSAHFGQKDKAGNSYILHCLRVMLAVGRLGADAMIIAVLHDSMEKDVRNPIVTNRLLNSYGFTSEQIHTLDLLTRKSNQTYKDYVRTLSVDRLARYIKIADLRDHLSWDRVDSLNDSMIDRYRDSLDFLEGYI